MGSGPGSVRERPNLVLAVLDTARGAETLDLGRLPGLRGLAGRGTVFRNAISPSPWTLPAHGSLFSGLLPHEHGLTGELAIDEGRVRPVEPRIRELADRWLPFLLRNAGYQTFGVSANPWISPQLGFGLGFERFVQSRAIRSPRFLGGGRDGTDRSASVPSGVRRIGRAVRRTVRALAPRADSGAVEALAAFRSWLGERGSDAPFFAFFNFMEPHLPYLPPRPFAPRSPRLRLATARLNAKLSNEFVVRYNVRREELEPRRLRLLRSLYLGEIAYLDTRLAELDQELDRLTRPTLVVVVGDHGENLGEHHLLGHQASIAGTLLRVPLVVSGPEDLAGRDEVREPVSTARVSATMLRAGGIPTADPTVFDRGPDDVALSWYESAYAEAAGAKRLADGELAGSPEARRILTGRAWSAQRGAHKLVVRSDGTRELYDLEADPDETTNLAVRRPELLAGFAGIELPFEVPVTPAPPAAGEELEEIERHLESLGYL
jgi:arylsulfatase A-like enzyme